MWTWTFKSCTTTGHRNGMTLAGDLFGFFSFGLNQNGTCCLKGLWRLDAVSMFKKKVDKFMDKRSRNGYQNDYTRAYCWHPKCDSCGCLGSRRGRLQDLTRVHGLSWQSLLLVLLETAHWAGWDTVLMELGISYVNYCTEQGRNPSGQHRWKC